MNNESTILFHIHVKFAHSRGVICIDFYSFPEAQQEEAAIEQEEAEHAVESEEVETAEEGGKTQNFFDKFIPFNVHQKIIILNLSFACHSMTFSL